MVVYLVMKAPKYLNLLKILVLGLIIINSDESEYRDQVKKLISWCSESNLELNIHKTKEMTVYFRRKKSYPSHLFDLLQDS